MTPPKILEHGGMYVRTLFAGDGRLLVGVSSGHVTGHGTATESWTEHTPGRAIVWDSAAGDERCRFEDAFINDIDFVPGSHNLVTVGRRRVSVWDGESGQLRARLLEDARGTCEGVAVSPDGRLIGVGSCGGPNGDDAVVLDTVTGTKLPGFNKPPDGRTALGVRFIESGERLVGFGYTYDFFDRVYLWETRSGRLLDSFAPYGEYGESSLSLSSGGRRLAASEVNESTIRLWELQDRGGTPRWHAGPALPRQPAEIRQVQFSPDETTLVGLGAESLDFDAPNRSAFSVRVWDVSSGRERARIGIGGKAFTMCLAPDGRMLAVMSGHVKHYFDDDAAEYRLTVWDVSSGRRLAESSTPSRRTNLLYHAPEAMVFSPDGRRLAVAHTKHIELWDVDAVLGG